MVSKCVGLAGLVMADTLNDADRAELALENEGDAVEALCGVAYGAWLVVLPPGVFSPGGRFPKESERTGGCGGTRPLTVICGLS